MSNNSIWPINRTLSGGATLGQSGPGSDGNEEVLHTPQSSSIIGVLPSDCLVSYSRLVKEVLRGAYDKFPDFFVWALLLIVDTWNSTPLRSNLLRLQCTCCTVSTTSGRPHGSPLVWACQWPSSQPLSSHQLSHNDSF